MSERAIEVAGADDEDLLPVQRLSMRHASVGGKLTREERAMPAAVCDVPRPLTRGDCQDGERPCPWVGCAHHLYIDVLPTGSLKFNFPGREPWELDETCALDVADRGGTTLERVGELLSITRERVRQVEAKACERLRIRSDNDT